jgi:stage III sporulation protein AF
MSWLKEWIRNIVVLVLFAGFMELLLPSSSMKRFLQVVVGLFVLTLLLEPVVTLMKKVEEEPSFDLPAVADNRTAEVLEKGRELAERQQMKVLEEYRRNVARQVATLLELSSQDKVREVRVDVEEVPSRPDFGRLRSLKVILEHAGEGEPPDAKRFGRLLADFYGLPLDAVQVEIKREGG